MANRIHKAALHRVAPFGKAKQDAFLRALADLGDVDLACDRVGVPWQVVHHKRSECGEFRERWARIVANAFSRHVNGVAMKKAAQR